MEMAEDRRHSHVCGDSRMAISARGRACSLRLLTLLGPGIQDALKQPPHTPRYTSCLTEKPMGTVQKHGFQENPPVPQGAATRDCSAATPVCHCGACASPRDLHMCAGSGVKRGVTSPP